MGTVRFLLALSVLIVHSSPIFGIKLLPGYLAVQVFYIISGFYMALIYCEKYWQTSRPKFYFYTNRFLRLYPLYILVVLLTIGLSLVFGFWLGSYGKLQFYFDWYARNPDALGELITIALTNIILIGQDIITFFSIGKDGAFHFNGLQSEIQFQELLVIPIAWTVALEMFFYALTPFIVRSLKIIVCALISVMLIRYALYEFFQVDKTFTVYRFAPTELMWFLIGILVYKMGKASWFPGKKFGFYIWTCTLMAIVTYPMHKLDLLIFTSVTLGLPAMFYAFSPSRLDSFLGELTYPVYISHCLFLLIVGANRFPKNFGTGLPLLVLTLVFSVLIYYFFLRRIEAMRVSRLK